MGVDVYDDAGLMVTRIAGPAGPADRRLWQVTTPLPEGYVQLDIAQVWELVGALIADLDSRLHGHIRDELLAARRH